MPPVELLTLSVAEVVDVLPAESVARAVSVWLPLLTPALFHDQDHEFVPLAAVQLPPST